MNDMITVPSLRHPTIQKALFESMKQATRESRNHSSGSVVRVAATNTIAVLYQRGVPGAFAFHHRHMDITDIVLRSLREGHIDEIGFAL